MCMELSPCKIYWNFVKMCPGNLPDIYWNFVKLCPGYLLEICLVGSADTLHVCSDC